MSEIFTPSILVCDEAKENQKEETFTQSILVCDEAKENQKEETFTQSILVCDEAKENQKKEKYRNLGTYRELFYRKNVLQKRVILLGEAGAGKTTFSKHLTDVWCESTTLPQYADVAVLKEFDYLFYVSCKFSNKEESILDMIINQLFDEERMTQVALYVLKNHPESCFVLVDGADEWEGSPTSETGRRGDIAGLPSLTGVDDSVILITSRPWRFYALSKKTQNIFMRLEINGIKDIGELTYRILQRLDDPDPEQSSSKFLRQVREKNMSELIKIPLILIIALGSWVDDNYLHKSMCINYINIIQSFIRRSKGQSNWQSSEGKLQRLIPNLHGLEVKWEKQSNELPYLLTKYKTLQRYAGLFLPLGHQAFDLLFRENEQSLVFSKAVCKSYLGANEENDESINVCLALGILSKTESTTRGLKKIESYAFCRKTFQEFFAALWLASNYANKKSKLYKCIKNYDDLFDYEMLIKFLCGIDPMAGKQMWLDLAEDMENRVGKIEMTEMIRMQTLVCECMKQHALDPMDQASDQIYFCIPHIRIIINYDSDENILLLCHVLEEYSCNIKSVRIGSLNAEVQRLKLYGISPPALDLRKYIKLKKLELENLSIEGLVLPVEGARFTLNLYNVTMTHHDLEQMSGLLSSCSDLEELSLDAVICNEQSHNCCIPVLDLQKHNKLKKLRLKNLSVGSLLLPVEGVRMTLFVLNNVTMSHHHDLEQLSGSLSSYSDLEVLSLDAVICNEQSHSCCIPVLDLKKHNKLKILWLENLSVGGLLLHVEGTRMTHLYLDNVTMSHHDLEQLSGPLSSYLEKLVLVAVICNEQSHNCCIPVLDLQKHNKLKKLWLKNLSVGGLLLPVEGVRMTFLMLSNVTMAHHDLEQLSGSLSSFSDLEKLSLDAVICNEQSHNCCIPVLDLQKHNKLKKLMLKNLSVGALLLPVEGVRMTFLMLSNVTMAHQDLEQLSGLLSSYSDLESLYLDAVICNEQSHSCCIHVLDLQKHNKLKKLWLKNLSVGGLLLPVEGVRMTLLLLNNVTMSHHHDLEQLSGSLSSCSDLEKLDLDAVICNEQSHSCCIPVLDLQKHNTLMTLMLKNLSVGGLLLPVEGDRMTLLLLDNVTMAHQDLEQLSGLLSFYSDLESLYLDAVICNEQSHSCCIPVLDLQKHNKLEILRLENLSVEGLLLPVEGTRMTLLYLDNVTMSHHDLEQLSGSLSSYSDLEKLSLDAVICNEQSHSCCIPVLDLKKHNKLKILWLENLSVGGLLLPVEGTRMTHLYLDNVTMSHHDLEQLSGSLSSFSDLEKLSLDAVICNEQSHNCCIPVLDLQKHNKLKKLMLKNLSVGALLLPVEGVRMTLLELTNVTMSHHHDLEQLSGSLSSYSDLEKLDLVAVICNEQSHSCCFPVLDLQKHNKLEILRLENLSVGALLLPVEGVRMTLLELTNVTMSHHHDLEQLSGSLSSYSDLESLYLDAVICNEQSHSCCFPVLDLQKHNKLKKLMLKNLSVGALLLPVEGVRMTLLELTNVTMSHHHDLEQLSGSLSSYSDLEKLVLVAVICNEQSHSCCFPVLDLQKHNKLKKLMLKNLSVGGLLLPVEGVRMTLLLLNNVTMSHHHDLEQLSGSLSSYSDLEELDIDAVICNEQSHSCCIPVLDLQKHNKLKKLWLKNLSVGGLLLPVEGVRMTFLMISNVTMAHQDLEQLSGLLSSYSDLESLYLDAVICNEQSHSCCIHVLDLQKHNKLKKLWLKNLSVGGLLLPVEGVRMTLLLLNNVTMSHHHDLEQLSGSLSSCSDLEKLDLDAVICNEQSHSCCIPVLDLQKHNTLMTLMLKNLSVGGLLLPVEGDRMTLLLLDNVTMAHQDLEQLSGLLSFYSDLESLYLDAVICNEQSHSCCIPVLDLQKHNKLEILRLENLSVEGLLLPVEGTRMTLLYLDNVTMSHHDLEQLSGSLSSYSDLEKLSLDAVICNEQSHSCCIPVLDLKKHNKLKILWLENLSVGGLLLPVEGTRMTHLYLDNVTMSHHDLEQLSGSLSSFSDLEKLSLDAVICNEQSHNCCIPVLDLQKHNKLKKLMLKNLSVGALLLPVEGVRMTLLELTNVTMSHHHDLEQLSGSLSSYSDLEKLDLVAVICNEQSHSCCFPVLDLQKHNKLKKLMLKNLSVGALLLPVEGVRMTLLELTNVTMSHHHDLEQLSGSLSSYSDLEKLVLVAVICNEQSHSCCFPVLDLQKHNKLKKLMLKNLSVGGLLLPVEGVR